VNVNVDMVELPPIEVIAAGPMVSSVVVTAINSALWEWRKRSIE